VAFAVSVPVDCVPLMALGPDHAPEAVQAVALVEDHVRVDEAPLFTLLGLTKKVIVGAVASTDTLADCVALPPAPVQDNV
jgi:hypothetical protein